MHRPPPVATPHVSVVICTWNRAESLRRTLAQMSQLVIPDGLDWELLVIDNGSTDDTRTVIDAFAETLPIRGVHESTPGLANARNCAIVEARGTYLIFTDDDILVNREWLAAYCRAFARWPDASIFGGPIEPRFEGQPPGWIPRVLDRIGAVYGKQSMGDAPVALSRERIGEGPYGGNMAMRRDALERFAFDVDLGVRHGHYAIGEESDVINRMLAAGLTGWWTPEPRVEHVVPIAAQNEAYVKRWMIGCGRYIARAPEQDPSLPTNHLGRLYARLLRHELSYLLRRRVAAPEVWITHLVRAGHARGRILEARLHQRKSW